VPEYLGDALFELRANVAPLRRTMAEAEAITMGSVRRMETGLAGGLGRMSSRFSTVGHSMTRGLTIPIIGIGAAAGKMAIDFQAAMENIHTQAGASQKEVDKLSVKVLALAKTVPYGPVPLADALYHLESIGLRLNKSFEQVGLQTRKQIPLMQVLKVAAEGAAVGHANLEQTTTALGSAWLSGIQGAQDLGKTMGTLNAIVGTGNMRMGDLVTALGTGVLPMAKLAGLSLKDVGAALAIMSDEGYNVSSAATQMGTALHYLFDPTKKASDALGAIGLKTGQLAGDMHKPEGLLTALRDLQSHLDATFPKSGGHALTADQMAAAVQKFSDQMAGAGLHGKRLADAVDKYKAKLKELGSAQTAQEAVLGDIFPAGRGRVLLVLMNQLANYESKLHQIGVNQGRFGEQVRRTQETAAYKIHQAWASIQSDLTSIGEKVLPIAAKGVAMVANEVDKVVNAFQRLSPATQKAIVTGGLIVAAVGPAMRVASFFLGGMKLFVNGVEKAWGLVKGMGALATGRGAGGGGSSMVAQMRVAEMVVGNMTGAGMPPMRGGAPTMTGTRGTTGTFSAPLGGGERSVPAGKPHFRPTAAQFYPPVYAPPPRRMFPTSAGKSPMMAGAEAAGPLMTAEREASVASGFAKAGGMALRAAGVAGMAALFAPAGATLGKALFRWLNGPEPKGFGEQFADKVTDPWGSHLKSRFTKALTDARNDLEKSLRDLPGAQAKGPTGMGGPGDQVVLNRLLRQGTGQTFGAGSTQLTPQEQHEIDAKYTRVGRLAGKVTVSELSKVKFISPPTLLRDFQGSLDKLPRQARGKAAQTMLQFAHGLVEKGKLPAKDFDAIIQVLEQRYPELDKFLRTHGLQTAKNFADTMKFDTASKNLKETLGGMAKNFGYLDVSTKIDSKNLWRNVTTAVSDIKRDMNSDIPGIRKRATAEFRLLKRQVSEDMGDMAKQVENKAGNMKDSLRDGSQKAKDAATDNFNQLATNINAAVKSGALATQTATGLLVDALNATLVAFGAARVPKAAFKDAASVESYLKYLNTGRAGGSGHGTQAARGLLQIGNPGDRGADDVPVNILAGRGERVAVFNAAQQAVMDRALAPMGGMQGMFANVTQPHYATPRFSTGGPVPNWSRPKFAGGGFATMVKEANSIDAKHYSYVLGGGHNMSFSGPYDCSGAVSAVLHSAGLLRSPLASQELSTSFLPGPGLITIYAHGPDGPTGHAIMSLGGRFFGTSGSNPGGGAGWFDRPSDSYLAAFQVRHAPASGGLIPTPKIAGKGTIPTLARRAVKMEADAANKMVLRSMPTGPMTGDGGDSLGGGVVGPVVTASWYSDHGTGAGGLVPDVQAVQGFAELSNPPASHNWSALGGLPFGTNIEVGYGGRHIVIPKLDVGAGGAGVNGHVRAIDFTGPAKDALNFPGLADVTWRLHSGAGTSGGPRSARQLGLNSRGGFIPMARGGFIPAATGHMATAPRQRGSGYGTGRPGHRRHSVVSPSTGRQLGVLSKAGAKVNALEQDIATWTARFNSMSGRFSTDEGQLQFLAEDGSLNAAGIAKKLQDDQTLYIIAYRLWQDYLHEIGPVSNELRKWLGVRSHTQKEIDTLNSKLTKNRIKEVNLERARQALSKPTKDVVGALRDAIKKVKHYWDPRILAAEGKVKHFQPRTVPPLYRGTNKTKRAQNQAARAAAIKWNSDHKGALQGELNDARLRERGALLPLNEALDKANTKNRKRKNDIAKLRYQYNRELSGLRANDVTMHTRVKTLKGVLAGEPGATGDVEVDKSISLLEGVADKLGTVVWSDQGKFMRIDTQSQGAAYDQRTQVESLATSVGQDKLLKVAPAQDTIDNSVLAGYYQDIAQQNALKFAISQAQTAALRGMPIYPGFGGRPPSFGGIALPPYAGSFATGGIVPGPLGAPRTAIVHGGEIIKAPDVNNNVKVSLEDFRTRVQVDDVEHVMDMVNRRMTRSVQRRLPGNGGGIQR